MEMLSASLNRLSWQGRLAVNYQRPAETRFGQFSVPLRGADQDQLPNPRGSRFAAKCRLLQDQVDGILLGIKTRTADNQEVTSHQTLNTVCPGWYPCCPWQNQFLDLVTATLQGLPLNLDFRKRSQIRSSRWMTDPCKVKAMKDMLWRDQTHLQMSGEVNRRCKQERLVARNGCRGSVTSGYGKITCDVNRLPELVLSLNQNNNGHANEEQESDTKENKREGSKSRDEVFKSIQTTARNPRHSYQQRRHQRNTGHTQVLRTDVVINHEHEKVSMIRHLVVAGSSGEPNKASSSYDKYPTVTQTQSTTASVKEECTTAVLKKLLETLTSYHSSSDVPPILKDQLFTAVLQPFLHGGYNSRLSVMSNFLTNPAILPPAADSPDHLVVVHDQNIPEAQSKQSKHVMVTPSAVNRGNESTEFSPSIEFSPSTEFSPSIDFSSSTEFSPSIDFSPSIEFSPSIDFSTSHPNTDGKDPETRSGRDLSYRQPYVNEMIDNCLLFVDNPTDDENAPVQDVRSPSFVPLGQHGKSGTVSPSCESLGQHGHCGFDIYFEIDECKPFSQVHTRVGARYHLNTFTYNITSPDETISEIQKPFSSEFVFKSVFGSSMTICSEFWNIHPPVLPSHLIKFKVLEDGISDKVIGRGCFGQVVEGSLRLPAGERDVVIKEHYLGKTRKEDIIQEARVSLFLESTGSVPICYGLLQNTYGDISILLELFGSGCTLKNILLESNLQRVGWLSIVCQLAAALGKIHEKHILINDIKPDNILVDMSNTVARVKFCDMGSASYKSGVVFQDENMEIFSHLAPEVRMYSVTTKANDIYGFGKVIQQIYLVSQISNLLPVYLKCTTHRPTDRLTTNELSVILTTMYRKEFMSSMQHNPTYSVQHHPMTSEQHHPMSSVQDQYIIGGLNEENTSVPVRSSSKKMDTVSATCFSEEYHTTSLLQDLSTSSEKDHPTSSVQDLPTSSVQNLPTPYVQDIQGTRLGQKQHGNKLINSGMSTSTNAPGFHCLNYMYAHSSTMEIKSDSSVTEMLTLSPADFFTATTSPQIFSLYCNTDGRSQPSANASVASGDKDTLEYPSQIEASSPNCSFLTAAELSTTTLRPCTPCTSLASIQRICDKKLRKHHKLYKSQPDYELTVILLLILVLLFLPGLIISGVFGLT